jgi:hypothetical protein
MKITSAITGIVLTLAALPAAAADRDYLPAKFVGNWCGTWGESDTVRLTRANRRCPDRDAQSRSPPSEAGRDAVSIGRRCRDRAPAGGISRALLSFRNKLPIFLLSARRRRQPCGSVLLTLTSRVGVSDSVAA